MRGYIALAILTLKVTEKNLAVHIKMQKIMIVLLTEKEDVRAHAAAPQRNDVYSITALQATLSQYSHSIATV